MYVTHMQHIEKNTIKKYLRGSANPDEVKQVEQWYSDLDAHEKSELSEFELLMVKERIYGKVSRTVHKSLKGRRVFLTTAAMILVLFVLGITSLFTRGVEQISYAAAEGDRARISLPDGSLVVLNSGSTLTYPSSFKDDLRKVVLEGEAFFSIEKDASRPFIVDANDVNVRVLGTRFNVDARSALEEIKVTVEEGTVAVLAKDEEVASLENALAVLNAEEQLVFAKGKTLSEKKKLNTNVVQDELKWRNEELIFRNRSLEEIATSLAAWYGVSFEFINPELRACTYTANFDSSLPLERVLGLLKEAQEFDYVIKDDTVQIDGKACSN